VIRALAPDEIFARRRWRAIAVVYVWELAFAILTASPAASWAKSTFGGHPDGDAPLFAGGGRLLIAWLGGEGSALPVVLRTTFFVMVAGALLAQLPLGILISSLATGNGEEGRAPSIGQALRGAAGSFLPLGGVLTLAGSIEGLVMVAGAFAAGALDRVLANRIGDARALIVAVVTFASFGVIACVVGVVADLARAAIVRDVAISDEPPISPWKLLARGVRQGVRARIGAGFFEWLPRAGMGIALVALGGIASELLGGRGGLAFAALVVVHQGIVLARVALRASWLARALRIVGA
jgi:hypothetical protein